MHARSHLTPPRHLLAHALLLTALGMSAAHADPQTETSANPQRAPIEGLTLPESVVAHPDGRLFITEIGQFATPGDGKVTVVHPDGRSDTLADGLDDPKGIVLHADQLYLTDITRVLRISLDGSISVFAGPEAFPKPPVFLNDIEVDAAGTLYVSDTGNDAGEGVAIHAIATDGSVRTLIGANAGLERPNGVLSEGPGRLLIADFANGKLLRLSFDDADKAAVLTEINQGFGSADGLARTPAGDLYISDWSGGNVWRLASPEATPELIAQGHQSAADIALSADGKTLLMPDMKAGRLIFIPLQ